MDIANMMQQAKAMQEKMKTMQDEIALISVTGSAGGGMVNITMKCNKDIESVKLDPSVINAADKEMLEDLIVAAINDANKKADEKATEESKKIMGGMGFPAGMDMPF